MLKCFESRRKQCHPAAITSVIAANTYTVSIEFPNSSQPFFIYGLHVDVACGLHATAWVGSGSDTVRRPRLEFVNFAWKLSRCSSARSTRVAVLLAIGSLSLSGCSHGSASATCTMKQLISVEGKGYLKLPPSHDNDVGRGRIPDTSSDADLDANQRAALCAIFKSEVHLPG